MLHQLKVIQIKVVNGNITSIKVSPSSSQDVVSGCRRRNRWLNYYFVSTQAYADELVKKIQFTLD